MNILNFKTLSVWPHYRFAGIAMFVCFFLVTDPAFAFGRFGGGGGGSPRRDRPEKGPRRG